MQDKMIWDPSFDDTAALIRPRLPTEEERFVITQFSVHAAQCALCSSPKKSRTLRCPEGREHVVSLAHFFLVGGARLLARAEFLRQRAVEPVLEPHVYAGLVDVLRELDAATVADEADAVAAGAAACGPQAGFGLRRNGIVPPSSSPSPPTLADAYVGTHPASSAWDAPDHHQQSEAAFACAGAGAGAAPGDHRRGVRGIGIGEPPCAQHHPSILSAVPEIDIPRMGRRRRTRFRSRTGATEIRIRWR